MVTQEIFSIGIDARLWNETGVGRYIRNLVWNLAAIDTNNRYILFFRKPEFDHVVLPGKNFEKRLADFRWHSFDEQYHFPRILQKEHLDLVHFPYFSYPFLYSGSFVLTIHDLILHHFPTGKASTLPWFYYQGKLIGYKMLLFLGAKRAKAILTVSEATKKEIMKHFHVPSDNVTVGYEGVDEKIRKVTHRHFSYGTYFLYVGNAYPHKNLERLFEAFMLFKRDVRKDVKLICVGREDYFYQRLSFFIQRLGLSDSVIIKHSVDDTELGQLYRDALAVLVPSLMEGFGLPALEAMSERCLVLASDIPVMHEVCEDAAVYFDPYRPDEIASVLRAVWDRPKDYVGYIKKGTHVAKKFSWRNMAEKTLAVYLRALL